MLNYLGEEKHLASPLFRIEKRIKMSTLRKGDRGAEVKELQVLLTSHGYSLGTDGIFGSGTEATVKEFQKSAGLSADGIVGKNTWNSLRETSPPASAPPPGPLPHVIKEFVAAGHDINWRGDYHLNLFGIRSPTKESNSFDDTLGCAYTVDGQWIVHYWPGTCDPGTYYLENPMNVAGTAVLVADQYKDVWKIDMHAGKYEALCQRAGKVRVYRDSNRDDILDHDPGSIATGYFGINLHRSSLSGESTQVNKWSAGCQVHATLKGFKEMMRLAHQQVDKTGIDTFSYTLLEDVRE